jgi:hypothetical protein
MPQQLQIHKQLTPGYVKGDCRKNEVKIVIKHARTWKYYKNGDEMLW